MKMALNDFEMNYFHLQRGEKMTRWAAIKAEIKFIF